MKRALAFVVLFACSDSDNVAAQNEAQKWYFGNKAGLDFSTSPPAVLNNSAMWVGEGCATVSDGAGNLLFYTKGDTIWNRNHLVMANGTGLAGNPSTSQGALIVKRPGSNSIYFVFTQMADLSGGLYYSIVDMSLAGGSGAVTTLNIPVYTGMASERMTAVRHSNCTDVWVITHDWNSDNFRANLVTAAGVSTGGTVSAIGTVNNSQFWYAGCMKASPDGKKLGVALAKNVPTPSFPCYVELYDFNNTTGIVSNPLIMPTLNGQPWGVEFSPDGSKFYASFMNNSGNDNLYQYDVCAGSNSAIAASVFTISSAGSFAAMQRAPDGKIYIARVGASTIATIGNPNAAGASCGYTDNGVVLTSGSCIFGLPNFYDVAIPPEALITPGISCNTASFSTGNLSNLVVLPCSTTGFSATAVSWNFGDPSSGSGNGSSLLNPTHTYSAAGIYSVSMVISYSCAAFTNTVTVPVVITATSVPSLTVSGNYNVCNGEQRTYTASGAGAYSWTTSTGNSSGTSSLALTATAQVVFTVSANTGNNCAATKVYTVTVKPCTKTDDESADRLVSIFPNPASENLSITFQGPGPSGVESYCITDNLGRNVREEHLQGGSFSIQTSALPSGFYQIHLKTPFGTVTKKFLKSDQE
jgi:hypothetical protein